MTIVICFKLNIFYSPFIRNLRVGSLFRQFLHNLKREWLYISFSLFLSLLYFACLFVSFFLLLYLHFCITNWLWLYWQIHTHTQAHPTHTPNPQPTHTPQTHTTHTCTHMHTHPLHIDHIIFLLVFVILVKFIWSHPPLFISVSKQDKVKMAATLYR